MTNTALSIQNELVELPDALQSCPPPTLSVQARQSFQEGITHLQSGEAAQAVSALSRCIEHAPDFTYAHVFLGMSQALTYNIYPAIDPPETPARHDEHPYAAHFLMDKLRLKLR